MLSYVYYSLNFSLNHKRPRQWPVPALNTAFSYSFQPSLLFRSFSLTWRKTVPKCIRLDVLHVIAGYPQASQLPKSLTLSSPTSLGVFPCSLERIKALCNKLMLLAGSFLWKPIRLFIGLSVIIILTYSLKKYVIHFLKNYLNSLCSFNITYIFYCLVKGFTHEKLLW